MNKIYYFISSMKTGLALLVLIGLASALGSSIMPGTFYQSFPFKLLLLLLFLNMAFCTINRFSRYFKKTPRGTRKNLFRLRDLGILLLHAGVVLVIVGGAIYSFFGQSTVVRLVEGETVNVSDIMHTENPFSLKLNKFKIAYYPDGSPSQYFSDVSIINNGRVVMSCRISVNHPLQYAGIKAYQQSFGYLIKAQGTGPGGMKVSKSLNEGDFIDIPGTDRRVKAYRYIPNFDPQYGMNTKTLRPDNPRIIFSVYEKGNLLGVGAASPGESIKIDEGCYVKFNGVQPYTILKVKSDPGLPLAAAGGLMLMAGVTLIVFLGPGRKNKKKPAANGKGGETGSAAAGTYSLQEWKKEGKNGII